MPDEPHRAAEAGSEPRPGESADAAPILDRPSAKSPLITAVEIENFKGIGRRVRIDLRPITLLFGRNSAGKSTILHALCYAHDILSHGNVDAGRTDLGGAEVDLGGFRRFVHAHDRERAVRLRFEMNLEDWEVPGPLVDNMQPRVRDSEPNEGTYADRAAGFAKWIRAQAKAESVRSGWVELAVQWRPWPRDEPVLVSYEVGVNGVLFGRVARAGDSRADFELKFDRRHPLLDPLESLQPSARGAAATHVHDAPPPGIDVPRLHRVKVRGAAPLPAWDQPISLMDDDRQAILAHSVGETGESAEELPVAFGSRSRFEALVSAFLVGIGRTLRDELAALRYVGPARKLRPRTDVEPGSRERGSWSDGSAAWNLLLRRDPDPHARDLLDDVNRWLENGDRLDTGYKLARQSTVQLPEVTPGVWQIGLFARLPAKYRNGGKVDMDHWARKQAEQLADRHGYDPDDVEARIKDRRSDKNGLAQSDVTDELVESYRELYKIIADDIVAAAARIEKGGPATKALVQAIAAAPLRTTLQLVTAGTKKLQVRTSDIGVGVSQVLPVVAAALDPQRPGITAIEQPELHLHPRMQVELGDLFAQSVDQGGVFLLENHSEHLMLRLLRRIEQTHGGELPEGKPALKPDQVSVVYLDRVDGEVTATRLRINEEGEFIDRWPHGFFDERADELF